MNKKSSKLATILNFIIWGSGYIYLGKRKKFGVFLLIGYILWASSMLTYSITLQELGTWSNVLLAYSFAFISVALGIDANSEAKSL